MASGICAKCAHKRNGDLYVTPMVILVNYPAVTFDLAASPYNFVGQGYCDDMLSLPPLHNQVVWANPPFWLYDLVYHCVKQSCNCMFYVLVPVRSPEHPSIASLYCMANQVDDYG